MLVSGRFGTRDLDRAKGFYDEIAPLLGAARVVDAPGLIGYSGANGGMFMVGTPLEGEATVGNGSQMVFSAPNREAVDAVHAKALELGGRCEGPPGQRGSGEYAFYGAYFRDLDGNKLMAIHSGGA